MTGLRAHVAAFVDGGHERRRARVLASVVLLLHGCREFLHAGRRLKAVFEWYGDEV